ncbi:unnamed protein product [Prorocentrum cordatum]|uniref:Uncharacterized protein n=1 Tax=Prorocentrum cordatum TaxID=2364126 RepID=A0ABN9T1Y2_9DINO|nr:unnamed protein product [Polarella glacialis]
MTSTSLGMKERWAARPSPVSAREACQLIPTDKKTACQQAPALVTDAVLKQLLTALAQKLEAQPASTVESLAPEKPLRRATAAANDAGVEAPAALALAPAERAERFAVRVLAEQDGLQSAHFQGQGDKHIFSASWDESFFARIDTLEGEELEREILKQLEKDLKSTRSSPAGKSTQVKERIPGLQSEDHPGQARPETSWRRRQIAHRRRPGSSSDGRRTQRPEGFGQAQRGRGRRGRRRPRQAPGRGPAHQRCQGHGADGSDSRSSRRRRSRLGDFGGISSRRQRRRGIAQDSSQRDSFEARLYHRLLRVSQGRAPLARQPLRDHPRAFLGQTARAMPVRRCFFCPRHGDGKESPGFSY